MIRAKLISPTNLLLEHPILSPVEDPEFFVITVSEYKKNRNDWTRYGVLIGLVAAVLATALASYLVWLFR